MKKIFILALSVVICLQVSAKRYLVQSGETGTPEWRAVNASADEELIDLKTLSTSLGEWYNTIVGPTTSEEGHEIWITGGTFTIGAVLSTKSYIKIYGGFKGAESATGEREKGDALWIFTNPTVLDANNLSGVLNSGGSRSGVIIDGITVCNVKNGRGIIMRGSEMVQNCIVENVDGGNGTKGGGVFFYKGGNMKNSLIRNNKSGNGGGIAFLQVNEATSVVENCVIENNTVTDGKGSGVYLEGSPNAVLKNCLTYNNYGSVAIYIHSGTSGGGTFCNLTVAETKTKGLYSAQANIAPVIYNSVFWGKNEEEEIICEVANVAGGPLTMANCAIVSYFGETWDCTESFRVRQPVTGDREIEGEIMYYTGFNDVDNFDFTLTSASDLIDKGVVVDGMIPETDLFGNPRVEGNSIDIGCFEFKYLSSNIKDTKEITAQVIFFNKVLQISNAKEPLKVGIYDVSGKLVKQLSLTSDYQCNLPGGLYFVKVEEGKQVITKKVISL